MRRTHVEPSVGRVLLEDGQHVARFAAQLMLLLRIKIVQRDRHTHRRYLRVVNLRLVKVRPLAQLYVL